MKEYVVLTINDGSLIYDFRSLNEKERDHINTNIFYENSLYYEFQYFKRHITSIANLFKDKNIEILIVRRIVTFKYVALLMTELEIEQLRLLFNSTLSIDDYNLILYIHSLKSVDCYYMPDFMRSKYEARSIKVSIHNKYEVTDHFMLDQDAIDYDTLYYKKDITLKKEYDDVLKDVEEFLRINYNLKAIHLYIYSKEIIKKIVELVKNDESKNVIVFLHQTSDKGDFITTNFVWLKELNKKCKEDESCEFRIVYSDNYVRNNLFKQLSFNNLKLISILGIYICAVSFLMVKSYYYVEKLNVEKLNQEIMNESLSIEDENLSSSDVELDDGEKITEKEIKTKYTFSNTLSALKKKNKETKGFLVVHNTNINYPIVQHSDNNYYLKRDFYKNSTSMGWLFLDYRNDAVTFDHNNIIYGHSMLNGTMFGTLKKVLSSSWRKTDNNMIIEYSTPKGNYKFKIFSAYKVDYTTDYLKTNFESKKAYNAFVKKIKNRSVFSSSVTPSYGDAILTLSTCTGSSNKRLVVHAVLIVEEGE